MGRAAIHNTANDASAKNEVAYMLGSNNKVSFHYAVDNTEIVQAIPNERNAWHAGDGGSGAGNRKYISIEICYSKSGGSRFEAAMKNAAWLTAKLLREYGWGIGCVKKHQDFSGKYCPHRILDDYGWDYFLDLVRAELGKRATSDEERPILKNGSAGEAVKRLQTRLNELGFNLAVDGSYGPAPLVAVKNFQHSAGLEDDGLAGPLTWAALNEVKQVAKFPDTAGHWAEKTIDELDEMGIAHGDGSGSFRPDDKITRAEAATLVRNAVKYVTGK